MQKGGAYIPINTVRGSGLHGPITSESLIRELLYSRTDLQLAL